jgi:hypothetical protein
MPKPSARILIIGAIVVVLAAGVVAAWLLRPQPRPERSVAAQQPAAKLHLVDNSSWNGFNLELEWNPIEDTEKYLVNVYDSNLRPLTSKEVVDRLHCSFLLDQASQHRSLWVRVRALKEGSVLEDSGILILTNRRS